MESKTLKEIALDFLNLCSRGKSREAFARYAAPGFRHHNIHFKGDAETLMAAMEENARQMPDKAIAAVLNRAGKRTGRDNGWTQSRVCTFRNQHDIAVYRDGERTERGELTLDEAAAKLTISPMTVLRLIHNGIISARQLCRGAP